MTPICVFDTETTSLDKPFCYNIGYIIADIETNEIFVRRDFVVEQIWHNLPLFQSAFYADKRPIYVNRMKARQVVMDKFGYICAQMRRDFRAYNVERAYAFNSDFDERVFAFNCDWFKCVNPFEAVQIFDIRAFAVHHLCDDAYKAFCESHNLFTENGNYSTTAEAFFRFLEDENFVEEHTALADSLCEYEILRTIYENGFSIESPLTAPKMIPRKVKKEWTVKVGNEEVAHIDATGITVYKSKCIVRFAQ